jgi:ribosome maturation factor RimP
MVQVSPVVEKIIAVVAPSLEAMQYELVQVRLFDRPGGRTLQIMAERTDKVHMTVEDCAEISNTVSALLDVEDPIQGAYDLEVSSPGIDRPLVKLSDYEEYAGHEAKVETEFAIDNRKRWKGIIKGVQGKDILIQLPDAKEVSVIPFDAVQTAKLVLTDELVKKHTKEDKQEQA